jgi:predicted ATP-dependent serine protease
MPDILNTSLPQQKNDFVITDEIQSCIDALLNKEKFIFITGVAGTGKSQTLKHLISVCLQNKQNVAVIAPTAVAAMNVGGQTIHSFCKLERGILDRRKIKQNSLVTAITKKVDVLIIDEISMVRCDLFDAINACFQKNRNSHLFFGGVQLIVIGDLIFCQCWHDVQTPGRKSLNVSHV